MLDASFMKRLTQTEAVYVYSIGLMMSRRIGTIAEIARKLVSRGKIMKKHFENRQCIISSSIFSPSAANQMCCCKNCSKINRKNVAQEYCRNNPVRFRNDWVHKSKISQMSDLAMVNELARAAGKTYGIYVMQEALASKGQQSEERSTICQE